MDAGGSCLVVQIYIDFQNDGCIGEGGWEDMYTRVLFAAKSEICRLSLFSLDADQAWIPLTDDGIFSSHAVSILGSIPDSEILPAESCVPPLGSNSNYGGGPWINLFRRSMAYAAVYWPGTKSVSRKAYQIIRLCSMFTRWEFRDVIVFNR